MIPAGDSLAPGQLIPIVCKCRRLYLNSGSEPGLAGSRNPRCSGEGGALLTCCGEADAVWALAAEIYGKAVPRITPCQKVSLLLTGLGGTYLVCQGFCLCFELYFGSGAAVPCSSEALPWSSGAALPQSFALFSGEKPAIPLWKSLPLRASPVGQVWAEKIRGHRSPRALFILGAWFSHLCCFSTCAAIAEGRLVPLPVGTQVLWSAGCYATGAEAGQAWKTMSGFSSKVSRPLGVCRKRCRAGISCSKPWVADNSAVPI